jgi:hypothetical protein
LASSGHDQRVVPRQLIATVNLQSGHKQRGRGMYNQERPEDGVQVLFSLKCRHGCLELPKCEAEKLLNYLIADDTVAAVQTLADEVHCDLPFPRRAWLLRVHEDIGIDEVSSAHSSLRE